MPKLPLYAKLLIFLTCWPAAVLADPAMRAESDGTRVTLYDEPCKLEEVSNLPFRATWEEKGKTFEGCWGGHSGIVVGYFKEDRSVVAMPAQAFQRVQGI